ncbi:DNA repair protein RecN [Aestuariibacter halophilus]|uniref:DNA repair protein RecN n=1 Tax=Fluctibacter halophilus TaxID=226011 RepID=A0ABS8G6B5_9ALTE|nr:DNA repair protein RecN [Aestuariibacter halophilus]MCC2616063.1 DNA repair protein RecN [Aestuariibacter halophilus]
MLAHLSVRDFAIVKHLDIDLQTGLTTITGETGAGKSIAIDALGLCLGERAEATMVRKGASKAEVVATFNLTALPNARQWVNNHELDDGDDVIIRRIISAEGRSKAFVNGVPVPLQQLKGLGALLVSVHGQHAHHQLLKSDHQLQLVDHVAAHPDKLTAVSDTYRALQAAQRELEHLQASHQQRADRRQLLEYQVQELDAFALQEDEFAQLETEHRRLSHSQTLLEQAQISAYQLYEADEFNALAAVQSSLDKISDLQEHDASLSPIVSLLNEAAINIDEAAQQLRHYADHLEIDPMRMQQVEARYSQAMEFARKHQVAPEQLYACHQQLVAELASLQQDDDALTQRQQDVERLKLAYVDAAKTLSESRRQAATTFANEVQTLVRTMNMQQAAFEVAVDFCPDQSPGLHGMDRVAFMVTTNAGQAADRMEKVVSGGELSRIGLAIQVITSDQQQVPSLIFDEVDTGISGATASVVGKLLRQLGEQAQVLCVTHLPQVAACGHQQMFVAKFSDSETTETHMMTLDETKRVEELARLLAGDKLTDSALANARELLNNG